MLKKLLIGLLLAAAPAPSYAQLPLTGVGAGTLSTGGGGSYTGPGDISTGWVTWAGVRAFTAAIAAAGTQPLFNLIRASDSHTCDFLVATNGGVGNSANCSTGGDNGQSLSTWLTSTSGNVVHWYDQTGNSVQWDSSGGNQPSITISCTGTSKPCVTANGAQFMNTTSTAPTVNQGYSVSALARRNSINAYANIWHGGIAANNVAQMGFRSTSGQGFIGNDEVMGTASETVQHAFNGVFNTSSSVLNIDGTETTGTISSGSTGTGDWCIFGFNCGGASQLDGNISEIGVNTNAWNSTVRNAICANQRAYYGTSGSC